MLPQRLEGETMENYFHRTALEAGATYNQGMYNAAGSLTESPYFAWLMQLHSVKLKTRNQY